MSGNDLDIAACTALIEDLIWSKRRPPLHFREKVREGQRIKGGEIELFLVRPLWNDLTREVEESIAKTQYVRSRKVWRVLWKRGDLKWHPYSPCPEVESLEAFLRLVAEDPHACFWG
jgi:hypothetical protein